MNAKLAAYFARHAVSITLNDGSEELMLPLEKVQGFLDLIQPGDLPPDKLQSFYRMQAELVATVQQTFVPSDTQPDATS